MKYYAYEWAGANVWLFHLINNWRGPLADRVMLLGTQISDHRSLPFYVTAIALIGVAAGVREAPATFPTAACGPSLGARIGRILHCISRRRSATHPREAAPGLSQATTRAWQHAVHVVGETKLHFSLPSGHASFAVTVIAALWTVLRQVPRMLGIVFIGWVCISRVNVGAHFPPDVVASVVTGLPIVLMVRAIFALQARCAHRPISAVSRTPGARPHHDRHRPRTDSPMSTGQLPGLQDHP